MKPIVTIVATLITLALAAPAHADVWDFSWLSTAMFGSGPGGEPAVTRQASASTTATITAVPDGIQINFPSPPGTASAHVFANETASGGGNFAIGAVPMFFSRDGDLALVSGSSGGSYAFSGGTFASPDTFTLALSSGGSGPAGVQRFVGTGTREVAGASEPVVLLLVGVALTGAAWLRRRTSEHGSPGSSWQPARPCDATSAHARQVRDVLGVSRGRVAPPRGGFDLQGRRSGPSS